MADARSRVGVMAVLGALYAAQGIVYGFAGFVLVPRLAGAGVSLEAQTGLWALAGLPWVLKVFWGPVLDRFGARQGGRVRTFVAVAMLGIAATLIWMSRSVPAAGLGEVDIALLQGQWFLLSLLLSLQDVGTDALALDRVGEADRGLANGVMLGGHHVGHEGIGGMVLGAAVVASGMPWAMTMMAAAFAILSVVPTLLPPPPFAVRKAAVAWGPSLRAMVQTPAARSAAILAAVILVGDMATGSVSGELWVKRLGFAPEEIGQALAPVLLVASVAGYALAAAVVDRVGHRRATAIGSVGLGALWVAFGLAESAWANRDLLYAFVAVQAVVTAILYVGVHALLMGAAVPGVRATHFALFMALLNLPRAVAPTFAPGLVARLDFAGMFVATGLFQVAIGWVVGRTGRWPSTAADR